MLPAVALTGSQAFAGDVRHILLIITVSEVVFTFLIFSFLVEEIVSRRDLLVFLLLLRIFRSEFF